MRGAILLIAIAMLLVGALVAACKRQPPPATPTSTVVRPAPAAAQTAQATKKAITPAPTPPADETFHHLYSLTLPAAWQVITLPVELQYELARQTNRTLSTTYEANELLDLVAVSSPIAPDAHDTTFLAVSVITWSQSISTPHQYMPDLRQLLHDNLTAYRNLSHTSSITGTIVYTLRWDHTPVALITAHVTPPDATARTNYHALLLARNMALMLTFSTEQTRFHAAKPEYDQIIASAVLMRE